jgi:hypothetical protein
MSKVTNKGLRALTQVAMPQFSKLKSLHLSGHVSILGMGVASIVSNALQLQELMLQNCHVLAVAVDTKDQGNGKTAQVSDQESHNSMLELTWMLCCHSLLLLQQQHQRIGDLAMHPRCPIHINININIIIVTILAKFGCRDTWCHQCF